MKDEWFVIDIKVKGALVELTSAILAESGCLGTLIEDRPLDTFVIPDDELDMSAEYLLKAYFPATQDARELINELKNGFLQVPALGSQNLDIQLGSPIRMEDWAESWKQNFSTLTIGHRLVIRPSWEEGQFEAGVAVVELDPGMAFGTGTHGTTRLCLEILAELFDLPSPPSNMLDVGTGSGILALGAAALGCQVIVANDIDPDACEIARGNIRKNGFEERISVTELPLASLPGSYDLVVANILAEENVRLKEQFMMHLAGGGWLVLSGILKEKEILVRQGFQGLPLEHISTRYADEWVCLVFRRQE